MLFMQGYTVFLPGNWDVPSFLFSYLMIFVVPVIFVVWKVLKKTKFIAAKDIDLVTGVAEIDEYTRNFIPMPPKNAGIKVLDWLFG